MHEIAKLHVFLRSLAQGLVLKVPYFGASFYPILVLKILQSSLILTAHLVR